MDLIKLIPPEMPPIKRIKRSEWCEYPEPKYTPHKPERIVVHHTWKPTAAQFNENTVQAIYNYHRFQKGWLDIGYHFLVSPDGGRIYEGRPANVVGAHVNGPLIKNPGSIGICLIGSYDSEQPSREALYSMAILIFSLCEKYGIDSSKIFGHCEAWPELGKTCPGKNLLIELFGENRWKKLSATPIS